MTARVFALRDSSSLDTNAASAAIRLAVAATADDVLIAEANKLMPTVEHDPRENLVSSFCRMVSHLHMALTSMATPRRPFGRGELVLVRQDQFRLTEGTRMAVVDRFLAIDNLCSEIDFASGYIAAGIVPFSMIDEDVSDSEIFRRALLDRIDVRHEAFRSVAEDLFDRRRLAIIGQHVASALFAVRRVSSQDAIHLGRDVRSIISQSRHLPESQKRSRGWNETLNLMSDALVSGKAEEAWELLNDLIAVVATMRLEQVIGKT